MELGAEDGDQDDNGKPAKTAWRAATGTSPSSDSD
jgi:hypothetical protein